jgi:hypothetical protein
MLAVCLVAVAPLTSSAAVSTLKFESPANGSSTRNLAPAISGTSGDQTDEVSVEIFSGEGVLGTRVAVLGPTQVSASGAWSVVLHAALAQGVYTARAKQGSDANRHEALTTFTLDATPPAVSLQTLPTPSTNMTPTFNGRAGTEGGDVPLVEVTVYQGSLATGSPAEILRVSSSGASWTAGPAPELPEGAYTAVAEQADLAGNVAVSESVTYVLTPTDVPPTASLTWFPAAPAIGETVSLVSTSLGGSSAIVGFAWDLAGNGPFTSGGPVFTTKFATAGAHPVRLLVTDAHGGTALARATIPVGLVRLKPLLPSPIIRIAGTPFGRYVRIRALSVEAPPGALVTIRCRGRGCPRAALDRRVAAVTASSARTGLSPLSFPRFQRRLRAGVVLQIIVSRSGYMGKYTSYLIRGNGPPKRHDACKEPTNPRPIPCPPE